MMKARMKTPIWTSIAPFPCWIEVDHFPHVSAFTAHMAAST